MDVRTKALTPGEPEWADLTTRFVRERVKGFKVDVAPLPDLCRDFRQHRIWEFYGLPDWETYCREQLTVSGEIIDLLIGFARKVPGR
jgi:hypothetical protein